MEFEGRDQVQTESAHPVPGTSGLETPERGSFFVVGLGASAGGLEALEAFFDQVPLDSGLAFVVVQHLSPDFKSLMGELLARHTKLAIHLVTEGMEIRPDSVYLIPPKKEMTISGGKLRLSDKDPTKGLSLPIDTFLHSLAHEYGARCAAVILSGTGSDGSRGIQAIHESGGLVLAQDPDTAFFDGMPRSAVETGIVDHVLPPEKIMDAIRQFALGTSASQIVIMGARFRRRALIGCLRRCATRTESTSPATNPTRWPGASSAACSSMAHRTCTNTYAMHCPIPKNSTRCIETC